jgi:hypothetical protein
VTRDRARGLVDSFIGRHNSPPKEESVAENSFIGEQAFRELQHPLQRRRFLLAFFFALMLCLVIAAMLVLGVLVFVFIIPLAVFMFWLASRTLYARLLGNTVEVSGFNYPRIHGMGEELKKRLGYSKPVSVFVLEQSSFNAYLLKFLFYRKAVFLPSEVLENGVTDDEIRWLLGRFVGYLRAQQRAGVAGWMIRVAQKLFVLNLFLLPYERALVYTGDRLALAAINGDITSAISVMQKLLVGRQLGYSVNPAGIIEQQGQVKGSFFAFLARVMSAFPHQTTRYVDLIWFASQHYPAEYHRFVAENPGLPNDLWRLSALARPDTRRLGSAPATALPPAAAI